jgi:FkbM family methyltransferase
MLNNLKKTIDQLRRENARAYLNRHSAEFLSDYPQMCCYSFDLIATDINLDGRYEKAVLQFLLEKLPFGDGNVLDVGANIGNHAVAFAGKARHVFAFEPHPKTFELLRLNTQSLPNVTAYKVGASDTKATLRAISPKVNFGASFISDKEASDQDSVWTFDVAPIDSFPELQSISVFKLDVEGHEHAALLGARALLERDKPILVFEQHEDVVENGTTKSVEFLRSLGYAHLYALDVGMHWKTPQWLPGPLRKAARLVEGAAIGPADWIATPAAVTTLEQRSYPILIAAPDPLPALAAGSSR